MCNDLAQAAEKRDWLGQWIWLDGAATARNAYGCFRRRFRTEAAGSVRIAITADSFYELHVDGVRLGRGPSRSHLDYYSFDRYELALPAGEHVVAVLVHRIGVQNATVMTGRPGLLVEIEAGCLTFGTDADWRCLPGAAWRSDLPCLMSHFGFWEECDRQRLPDGWTEAAFDDTDWAPATVIGQPPCPPWTRLIEPDIPPPRLATVAVRKIVASGIWTQGAVPEDSEAKRRSVAGGWLPDAETSTIPAKQVAARQRAVRQALTSLPATLVDGAWLTIDFGRTVSGYPVLDIEADTAGVVLDLAYDDVTDDRGVVDPERSYARLADRFILTAGHNRVRLVHPRGFRYVMIDVSGAATLHGVAALEETYPFAPPAPFACSDPRLTGFVPVAAETVRVCTTDAFTDCATRERVQWMEDAYLHARVAAYAFGDTKLLRRLLFQGAQNALPDGRINGFMPSERTGCAFASSSLVWLHLLVDYWLFAGDDDGCRRLLPSARKLLAYVDSCRTDDGLIDWRGGQFWDWAPIDGQGCLLLTNAFHAWALARLAEHDLFRRELGDDPASRAAAVRQAAHARFWDAGRQLYRDSVHADRTPLYSQHANTLAVLAGICPAADAAALMRRAIDPANLGPIPIGEHSQSAQNRPGPEKLVPVGTLWFGHFIVEALFAVGLAEEALDQMRYLWGPYEGPTFPETRITAGNTTQCHGWAGGPAWLLPARVLGARPTGPGWSRVTIAPQPGGLAEASGTIPTPLGPLHIRWRRAADGQIALDVDAPAGMTIHREAPCLT